MNKVTAYFSHSIRGSKGPDATDEDVKRNCEEAIKAANWIRENIPELHIYVPAEHEEFVKIAWDRKMLNEQQVLEVDCAILGRRDLLIVHEVDGWLGGGIGVEITYAKEIGRPIFYVTGQSDMTIAMLREFVKQISVLENKNDLFSP